MPFLLQNASLNVILSEASNQSKEAQVLHLLNSYSQDASSINLFSIYINFRSILVIHFPWHIFCNKLNGINGVIHF